MADWLVSNSNNYDHDISQNLMVHPQIRLLPKHKLKFGRMLKLSPICIFTKINLKSTVVDSLMLNLSILD